LTLFEIDTLVLFSPEMGTTVPEGYNVLGAPRLNQSIEPSAGNADCVGEVTVSVFATVMSPMAKSWGNLTPPPSTVTEDISCVSSNRPTKIA
jgi:hypothetical protein